MTHPTLLVQLSDPHIVEPGRLLLDRIDTAALLAQAVTAVNSLIEPVTAVVITGDLVDSGGEAQYRHLRELLAPLSCPYHLMPGNHDDRDTLRRCFADQPGFIASSMPAADAVPPFIQYAVEIGELRLVTLDTLVVGAPALEALVRRHPQVEGVICGHLHRSIQARFGGTVALTAPSTAHQILLDLRPASDARYTLEPPGFLVHTWRSGRLVSHGAHSRIDGPPEPF